MTEDDKTLAQAASETTGIFGPDDQNKLIAQVGLKDLIAILHLNRTKGEPGLRVKKTSLLTRRKTLTKLT